MFVMAKNKCISPPAAGWCGGGGVVRDSSRGAAELPSAAADCQKSHGCDRSHNNLLLLQLVTNIVSLVGQNC